MRRTKDRQATAREHAEATVRLIARLLYRGPLDAADIARQVRLPGIVVRNHLRRCGPQCFAPEFQLFRREGTGWGLTARGRASVERHGDHV